ncbi:Uncharacterised protein [Vibrio cholerae]|nr:Uncharacterised protein [Vibrio cholerae]
MICRQSCPQAQKTRSVITRCVWLMVLENI